MKVFEIITLILSVISTGIIPLYFAFKKAKNELVNAKNDVEKEKSIIDMMDVVRQLIEIVERTFTEATGKDKKTAVTVELADYAKKQGYNFDPDYWSKVIDDLVAMTKKVNVKNG